MNGIIAISDDELIGQKFGKLAIVDFARGENGRRLLVCDCECGNRVAIRRSDVLNGNRKSCGCVRNSTLDKYNYLIGRKINSWTVLNVKIDRDCYYAICECDCGTLKNVNIYNLINGYSKDCGCGRKRMLTRTKSKDLIGQRFGKLVAVEKLDESNKFNRILYLCECDCGNDIIVPSSSLTTGHTRSCGCILSYYNMYIDTLLDEKGIRHSSEKSVNIDGHRYRFDFYLPDYNLMIEYDGEHHYNPVTYGTLTDEEAENNLERRQKFDRIKDNYCYRNNINLLRIPYWEKRNIEEIIDNHLQRLSERDPD